MKKLVFLILFIASPALASPMIPITRGAATRVCDMIYNATTSVWIGAAPTGLDCEIDAYTDGADSDGFTDISGSETTISTTGQFCFPLSTTETNVDWALVKCHATNTNAADWSAILTTRPGMSFDGKTLGEGTSTIDLEASEISADNQFAGDKFLLFSTAGKYLASSCIVSSTNANERITTREDLSALHTTGDYYLIVPDAGCSANLTYWNSAAVATPDSTGYPKVTIKSGTGTGEVSLSSGTVTVGTNNDKTGYRLSATGVDDIWDEATSGHTTAGTTGKAVADGGSGGGGSGGVTRY